MGCTSENAVGRESVAACAIGVMAKAPRPGFSKTRLCPPLRPDQAAGLSAAFLRDITENIALAARQASIAGYIAYAPEGQEALFDGHLAAGTRKLLADGSPLMPHYVQGFGRSLLHAILAMLARGHQSAVVLNSDSPTLPTALLVRTATALAEDGDRVVLGPADDGGYYLLGMKATHAHLFADVAWSTGAVAETTRARAAELGLEVVELPSWYDVDDHAALVQLLRETVTSRAWDRRVRNGLLPYAAPFTAMALARMGLRGEDLDLAAE
jgi:rSAM/selenodomain-associated transferase 1